MARALFLALPGFHAPSGLTTPCVPSVSDGRAAVLYPPAKDGGRSSEELATEEKGSTKRGTDLALCEDGSARELPRLIGLRPG